MRNPREKMCAEALWKTLVLVYTDPDDPRAERVAIPQLEAANALLSCLANLVSQIPDPATRRKIMMSAGPALERAVSAARARPDISSDGTLPLLLPYSARVILPD